MPWSAGPVKGGTVGCNAAAACAEMARPPWPSLMMNTRFGGCCRNQGHHHSLPQSATFALVPGHGDLIDFYRSYGASSFADDEPAYAEVCEHLGDHPELVELIAGHDPDAQQPNLLVCRSPLPVAGRAGSSAASRLRRHLLTACRAGLRRRGAKLTDRQSMS